MKTPLSKRGLILKRQVMIHTIRVLWKGLRWNQPLTVNSDLITADSVVHVSVSEAKRIYGDYFGNPIIERFLGAARMEVHNVSPFDGGVTFFIYVDWGQPLDVTTDVTILDPPDLVLDPAENQSWSLSTLSLGAKAQQFLTDNLSSHQVKQLQRLIFEDTLITGPNKPSAKILPSRQLKKTPKRKKS